MSKVAECKHDHESHDNHQDSQDNHESKIKSPLDLLKTAVKLDLPVDKGPEILKKISSDATKIDLTSMNLDLKKITTSELVNIVTDQSKVVLTETVKVETKTKGCKNCETSHVKDKQNTNGIPSIGGVLNALAKPLVQEKKEENVKGGSSPNGNISAKEGINPLFQGFGLLPPPPKIGIPNLLNNDKAAELPKLDFPKLGILDKDHGPPAASFPGLPLDPIGIIQSLLIRPILKFMEGMLEKGYGKLKEIAKYFAERPYLAMPLMVFLMSILLPVFLFILFAFMTTAIGFVGFVIAEEETISGTVLAMGGMVLTAFLVSFFSVILMFVTTYGVIYIGMKTVKLIK
ncbi:uncharacterized protein LOC143915850 [Arctopsyche grandis]|uniref:uncharacterized protein LOC143915850 n=1 Tax=Arctopsyche grandis TaxID=121162 RepID=UPI00406D7F35